jgi:hypothetical protein
MTLLEAIEVFVADHPEFGIPETAYCQCDVASTLFHPAHL